MDSIAEKINNITTVSGDHKGIDCSVEELLSLLEAVAREQDTKTLSCLDWGGVPQLGEKERLVTNTLKELL